jgi:hypothetical protein
VKFGMVIGMGRSDKRTRIGLVTQTRAVRHPNLLKPESSGKRFLYALLELFGVKGDGMYRRGSWEHERAHEASGGQPTGRRLRETITVAVAKWKSERPIVAMKRLIPVERRSLSVSGADSKVCAG